MYLLLTEFGVRTESYGPIKKKRGPLTYSKDWKTRIVRDIYNISKFS